MECVVTEPLVSPVHFEPQGELNCIRPLQGLGSVGTWGPGKSWAREQAAASWRGSPGNADPMRPSLPQLPAAQGSFPTSPILKALSLVLVMTRAAPNSHVVQTGLPYALCPRGRSPSTIPLGFSLEVGREPASLLGQFPS